MNTSGQWTGTITYGGEYGDFAGKTVQFDLDLKQTGTKITGLSKDIEGFGVNPDPADIVGEIIGSKLKFIKQYRTIHIADGLNTVDKSRKGPKILYFGQYDNNLKEFNGTWKMNLIRKFFWLIPINRRSTGTWKMKRKN